VLGGPPAAGPDEQLAVPGSAHRSLETSGGFGKRVIQVA